ncbi:hypothetical protein C8Q73DRAFT_299743 [Cubamyces lactineus]|nr:hypothetical protein C8Q73DRAFT_299743 [Cubamyces lactineus]
MPSGGGEVVHTTSPLPSATSIARAGLPVSTVRRFSTLGHATACQTPRRSRGPLPPGDAPRGRSLESTGVKHSGGRSCVRSLAWHSTQRSASSGRGQYHHTRRIIHNFSAAASARVLRFPRVPRTCAGHPGVLGQQHLRSHYARRARVRRRMRMAYREWSAGLSAHVLPPLAHRRGLALLAGRRMCSSSTSARPCRLPACACVYSPKSSPSPLVALYTPPLEGPPSPRTQVRRRWVLLILIWAPEGE